MRSRAHGFSPPQIGVLFAAFMLLISIPIWTHPLPPLSDYVNHLARMEVIATLSTNPQLAHFYEIDWQVIPNLTMDVIVPLLARVMKIYLAGQVFIVGMFALIMSGCLALNRALIGRWSVFPLFAFPLLYNYVFLVGLMNYIFGIGVALWALAGWVALRERVWPARIALSVACVVVVLLPSLGAGHLRRRHSLVRTGAAVAAPERAMAGAHRRFRRQRPAVPRRRAAAHGEPDHATRRLHLLGSARQDRRADVRLQQLFGHHCFRDHRHDGRRHRVVGPPPRLALSSAGLPAADRRRRGLFRAAAHHVRHLHDRSARAARRRLHAVRLRRSRVAPPPGAARPWSS